MSFCTKCGKEIASDAVYCQHCGAKVQTENKVYSFYMRGAEANNVSAQANKTEQPAPEKVEQPKVQAVEQVAPQPEVSNASQQVNQPALQAVITPAMQSGRAKYCTHCGSLIDENAVVCVRCGCNVGETEKHEKNRINGLAIAGFVLSLVDYFIILFVSVLGLIFSIISLRIINKKNQRGKGFAIAGLVLSIVVLVLLALDLISYLIDNGNIEFMSLFINN